MKLKIFFILIASFALPAIVFAGNSSTNSALIEETVQTASSAWGADSQILKNTKQALVLGLLIFDSHRDLNSMTENDQKIQILLEENIPTLLNTIQDSSDEIFNELQPELYDLTDLILQNQNTYTLQDIDYDIAAMITYMMAWQYAKKHTLLLEKTDEILTKEFSTFFFDSIQ